MLRLTGILTGSALAVAVLVFTIGIPQLTEPTGSTIPSPGRGAFIPPKVISAELPSTEFHVDEIAAVPQPEPTPEPTPEPYPPPEAKPAPILVEAEAIATTESLTEVQEAPAIESKWFAFWSPFRSEIAADGFVSELQRTTGLDYRVVKLKPGVYEVAFAYSDDTDREDKLSRIGAATGLDMSGG